MADIYDPSWSEVAGENSAIVPDGWPVGIPPDEPKDTLRETMGAVKREWDRTHPTLTLSASNASWGLTPLTPISDYADGQIFAAYMAHVSAAILKQPTLTVSGKGPKNVYVISRDGVEQPLALFFAMPGMALFFYFDASLNSGSGGFVLFSQAALLVVNEVIECPLTLAGGAVATGAGKFTIRLPYDFRITDIRASLTTAQTSGAAITVDVNVSGTSILSTRLTIDNGETTSVTAAIQPVIIVNSLALIYSADSEVTIDVDQIGDGTARELIVYLVGHQS